MICFDYHRNCRGGKLDKLSVLKDKAKPSMNEFGLFFAKGDQIVKYVLLQFLKGHVSLLSCMTEILLKLSDMLLAMCHLYLVDSSKNNDDDDVAWCLVMIMVMMRSMQAMNKTGHNTVIDRVTLKKFVS